MALLSESGTIADRVGAGGAALAAGAGRDCANISPRGPRRARDDLVLRGRIRHRPHTHRAGLHSHRSNGAAGSGTPPWGGAWGAVPGLGGLDPVVPRLS